LLIPRGARDEDIMRHTRHRDLRTMPGYVQRAGLVTESPAGASASDGAPDPLGAYVEPEDEVDVIAFLWASLFLCEDGAEHLDTVARYRPAWTDLYSVAELRARADPGRED
jgi:hypothetical protein